ncbi:hypothetical protein [Methylobacterium oryzae]|uniref:hypothetical protein n=1 Tax=Methylobacterium oryzae TaxID=334852 RepID=UPI002F357778
MRAAQPLPGAPNVIRRAAGHLTLRALLAGASLAVLTQAAPFLSGLALAQDATPPRPRTWWPRTAR